MDHSVDIVKKAFEHHSVERLPRGELWLGTDLFKKMNLEDDLRGHLALISRLGQDVLCLPLSDVRSMNKDLGYRYFSLKELEEASKMDSLFLAALIDGPFQRLADKKGLMKILAEWKQERNEIAKEYEKERIEVGLLIKKCLERSVDAIIIADDLAGDRSLFIDPQDIQALFSPFYIQAVSEIHRVHSYALFHSCGNITNLIPQLVSYGFNGLAAIQHRANDLIAVKKKYGASLALMGGIDAELLEAGQMSSSSLEEYERLIQHLSQGGGFILSSSSGLYSGNFIERIQELYRITDTFFNK
jgi:uroporphyrinogen decarboxylase